MKYILKKFTFFSLWLLLICNGHAQNNIEGCEKPADRNMEVMCKIAKGLNVSLYKVISAQFMASIEATALHCSFKLTDNYIEGKRKVISDIEFKKAFEYTYAAAKSNPPPNLSNYCQTAYNMAGPSIKGEKGVNGGPATVFFK